MAYNANNPVTDGPLNASDIRENFRALKEDRIVQALDIQNQGALATLNEVGAAQITNGSVGQNEIGAGAVHQGELDVTLANTSTTSGGVSATLTGGLFVFSPQIRSSGAVNIAYLHGGSNGGNTINISETFLTQMAFGIGGGGTAYLQWNYITSSPPYDLGDGEIPGFIFAIIDNTTQEIETIAIAEDPVWVHNGPTKCTPEAYDENGNGLISVIDTSRIPVNLNPVEALLAKKEAPKQLVRITQERKHADMNLVPHPFQCNDLTGKTVVLLDPVSTVIQELMELSSVGENINDIIHNNYLRIGNTPLNRHGPSGLLIPEVNWNRP